ALTRLMRLGSLRVESLFLTGHSRFAVFRQVDQCVHEGVTLPRRNHTQNLLVNAILGRSHVSEFELVEACERDRVGTTDCRAPTTDNKALGQNTLHDL